MLRFALWPFSGSASTLFRLCKHFLEKVQALLFFLPAVNAAIERERYDACISTSEVTEQREQCQARLSNAES